MVKASAIMAAAMVIAIAASAIACNSTDSAPLIFAAASLVDVMEEVATDYEEETGASVRFNFAGSNLIANQIIAGAPANGVIVAGRTPIDKLVGAEKISQEDAIHLLSNQLVVVRQSSGDRSINSVEDLIGSGRIAMPDPDTAPAGEYFEATLRERGVWGELEPQIIPALDARAALAAASTGSVDYALVYKTDAESTDSVQIALEVDTEAQETMPRYYAAPLQGDESLKEFIEFLVTPQAVAIFERYGFGR